jgi:hypothetical protein
MLKTTILLIALCLSGFAQSHQLAVSGGYNYQKSDQGHGIRANLNGWFASAEFDLSNTVSITTEVDNYYGSVRGENTAQQNFVLGPQLTFRSDKATLRPFVYLQGGDQRSASGSEVDHAFNLQVGGGVQLRLTERVSVQLTPAEYSLATPNGIATRSYSAKAGISWTVWKHAFPLCAGDTRKMWQPLRCFSLQMKARTIPANGSRQMEASSPDERHPGAQLPI